MNDDELRDERCRRAALDGRPMTMRDKLRVIEDRKRWIEAMIFDALKHYRAGDLAACEQCLRAARGAVIHAQKERSK